MFCAEMPNPRYWRERFFRNSTILCFDRVVVPNKGPSPKFHTVTGAFLSPEVMTKYKVPFLEQL